VFNGLSDHEAQLLALNLPSLIIKEKYTYYTTNINNYNIYDFQTKLSYENWESVFNNSDIDTSFNEFLNIFLRHLYSSFPLIQRKKYKLNSWITSGIVVSCRRKRVFYDCAYIYIILDGIIFVDIAFAATYWVLLLEFYCVHTIIT
jgi:hypothetical protein